MALLLKNAHVVDPSVELDGVVDVLIDGDKIAEVGENLAVEGAEVRDLSGKYLVPGLVDMHVHLREPGFEYKETIETGAAAAARGGFSTIACMPNTKPATDSAEAIDLVLAKANVATTPGAGFGPSGEGYIRLTGFGGAEDTAQAVERIKRIL